MNLLAIKTDSDRVGQLFIECFNEREKCLTVIGGGKMAIALVQGFVSSGFFLIFLHFWHNFHFV